MTNTITEKNNSTVVGANNKIVLTIVISLIVGLAVGAFVLSFDALHSLALASAISATIAWIWPLIIDGFIVTATIAVFVLRGREAKSTWYPWAALILFAFVSVFGNSIHAVNNQDLLGVDVWIASSVSAAPAVALLLASHFLVIMISAPKHKPVTVIQYEKPDVTPEPENSVENSTPTETNISSDSVQPDKETVSKPVNVTSEDSQVKPVTETIVVPDTEKTVTEPVPVNEETKETLNLNVKDEARSPEIKTVAEEPKVYSLSEEKQTDENSGTIIVQEKRDGSSDSFAPKPVLNQSTLMKHILKNREDDVKQLADYFQIREELMLKRVDALKKKYGDNYENVPIKRT